MITGLALHMLLNCCHLHLSTEEMPSGNTLCYKFGKTALGLTLTDTGFYCGALHEILSDGKLSYSIFIAPFSLL